MIHAINDGSGSTKFELCNASGENPHDDLHVHFRCEECGETICLKGVKIPEVRLPEGYVKKETTYVITGLCATCSH